MRRLLSSVLCIVCLLGATAAPAAAQSDGFSTDPVSVGFPNGTFPLPAPQITAVDFAAHDGFDRVVITYSGPVTGYRVAYGDRRDDLAERPVLTAGNAVVQVVLAPVSAGNAGTPAPQVNEFPGFPQLRQIGLLEDFEGVVHYGLAVASAVGFRVFTLTGPDRLVVDLRVPPTLAGTGARPLAPVTAFGFGLLVLGAVVVGSASVRRRR
jgi:hypothetical protein